MIVEEFQGFVSNRIQTWAKALKIQNQHHLHQTQYYFSKKITSRKSWWTSALRVRIRAFYEFHFKLNWWVHMTITTVEFICYSYLWNSSLTIRETMLAQLWPMIFIIESFHMINYISTKISWIEFGQAFNKTPSFEISSNLSLTYRESKNKRRKTSYWLCD